MRQQQLRERSGRDAGGGFACAGSFENVAGIVEAVLLHTGQVGVTGTNAREGLLGLARSRIHLLVPLVGTEPLGVQNLDGYGRAKSATMAHAADQRDLVDLEPLPRSAAVTEAPTRQLALDVGRRDRKSSGQALDDHDEGFAVGFSGGQETQHALRLTARVPG